MDTSNQAIPFEGYPAAMEQGDSVDMATEGSHAGSSQEDSLTSFIRSSLASVNDRGFIEGMVGSTTGPEDTAVPSIAQPEPAQDESSFLFSLFGVGRSDVQQQQQVASASAQQSLLAQPVKSELAEESPMEVQNVDGQTSLESTTPGGDVSELLSTYLCEGNGGFEPGIVAESSVKTEAPELANVESTAETRTEALTSGIAPMECDTAVLPADAKINDSADSCVQKASQGTTHA